MSLVEIKADPALLTRLVVALERLADGVDRLSPPAQLRGSTKPKGPDGLHVINNEAQWEQEQEQERRRVQGLPPEEQEEEQEDEA